MQPVYRIGKSEVNCYGVEGNIAMAHGPRRKILFINECNRKISYEVFDQLFSRSEITFVDFNPDREFWLHEKVLPNIPHVMIKSNFLDNPYLPENERNNILLKKGKKGFENWWQVYGLGEMGTLEGAIFQNWRYETEGEIDEAFRGLPTGYGLDYGFHPDPDAMTKVAIDKRRKIIYAREMLYANNNGTGDLIRQITKFYKPGELIVAESATPRTNADLGKFFNIVAVRKTRTVSEWLRELQDYEFVISENSYNLAKELANYIWHDKKAGQPIDGWNHLIDGIRYYYMNQSLRQYF
jgi:phage terminase large subunit